MHLVRHGESQGNVEGRIQGNMDSPLTPLGAEQAQLLAKAFQSRPLFNTPKVTRLIASDLTRAHQTASILGEAIGLVPTTDPRLREVNFGELEGLTWPEIKTHSQVSLSEMLDPTFVFPGGESRQDGLARAMPVFDELVQAKAEGATVVVTHGAILAGFVRRVLGVPPAHLSRVQVWNTSVTTVVFDGSFRLTSFGDISHLEGGGVVKSYTELAPQG